MTRFVWTGTDWTPKTAEGKAAPAGGGHWVTINGAHVLVDGHGVPVDAAMRDKLGAGVGVALSPSTGPTWDGDDVNAMLPIGQALVENLDALVLLHGDNALPSWRREEWRKDPSRLGVRQPDGEMPLDAAIANAPYGPHADYTDTDAMEKRVAARAGLPQRQVMGVTREWSDGGPRDAIGALELNKAAEAEFGVPASPWVDERLQTMRRERRATAQAVLDQVQSGHADPRYPYDVTRYTGSGWHSYPPMMEENRITGEVDPKRLAAIAAGEDKPPVSQAVQRKALRAMYDLTQEDLKKLPGDSVTLYRGVDWPAATPRPDRPGGVVDLTPLSMPLSSWSLNPDTARRFGNVIVAAKVPKRRILSTQHSGLGTIYEHEVVVLGGTGDQGQIWATSLGHGFLKSLAFKAAKPKAGKAPAGSHWVTINGAHVLVDGQGVPVDPKARARLSGGERGALTAPDGPTMSHASDYQHAHQDAEGFLVGFTEGEYRAATQDDRRLRGQAIRDNAALLGYIGTGDIASGNVLLGPDGHTDDEFPNPMARIRNAYAGGGAREEDVAAAVATKAGVDKEGVREMMAGWNDVGMASALGLSIVDAASKGFGVESNDYIAMLGRFYPKKATTGTRTQRKALRAMYDLTQEDLKKVPGDSFTLYRGIKTDTPPAYKAGDKLGLDALGAPLSSWTVDPGTATRFGDLVLKAVVPKSRILSTWRTGLGAGIESEVVVIGGKGDTAQVWHAPWVPSGTKAAPPSGGRWVTLRNGQHVYLKPKAGPGHVPYGGARSGGRLGCSPRPGGLRILSEDP